MSPVPLHACPLLRQTIPKGHFKLFFPTIQVPFQLPADCSVHSFIVKVFSPSAIITETEDSSGLPIPFWRRTRWWRNTLHSHLVVHEFCLNLALTDDFDFRDYFLHKKTLNFQGIEDTSQQFCAHCPYLREECSKGFVHDPDRYEPRETSSYHHGPCVQLQQANINTILSKSCSHCRVIPSAACHELQQGGSQATWHHCPAPSGEERSENSGNVAVFPYLWSVQQNWTLLKKKIREYWKQPGQTKPNQNKSAAIEERRSWELLYVLPRSNTFL